MIAHLTGKLFQKQPNSVIVDVAGVGYELTVPLSTFYDLGETGSEVSLRVYTYVREDALLLYGFRTEREKKLFLMLTSVSGIGPKLAITVLSGLSAEELIEAIRSGNLARLVAIPGVGRKTAERLIVELRDKAAALVAADAGADSTARAPESGAADVREDIISALVNLGYQKAAAERAVSAALKEESGGGFEALLKRALRGLSR
ncbi:MAG: Holliday junction branch migration protein RuvA [Acidobacteria bacterium]|nr:Holliday junction branch migration protein RuvA [Acidobacteriota bacterium]MCW5968178.1 Holliday junction branch migration protein RuvA [Blastocatellales bacterium]